VAGASPVGDRVLARVPHALLLVACLGAAAALAHERFVRHDLKVSLKTEFFGRHAGELLGLHPSMLRIGVNGFAVLATFLLLWFSRHAAVEAVQRFVLVRIGGRAQRALHAAFCFFSDRPVRSRAFHATGQWAMALFLRSPALVLMYSATHDSLVMPSYPLDPASAAFFKFAQAGLAILILTQTLLPLCGALILGTWLYLFRWGWMVAIDAVPILTVAAVYVTSPWSSHRVAITRLNPSQARAVRLVLGFGFLALGWLKVYNYNLVAGVADNYPAVLDDPLVRFFALGTDAAYRREAWVVAFGIAEILSGFLLMVGIFTRLWAALMIFVFTKLLLVDFGWEEIPHIYPIAALLALAFSNELASEVQEVERRVNHWRREGRLLREALAVGVPAVLIALAVVFPLLVFLSYFDRSTL